MPGWMKVYISLFRNMYSIFPWKGVEPQSRKTQFFTAVWQTKRPCAKKMTKITKPTIYIFLRKRLPVRAQWQNAHQLFGKENCKSFFQLFATFCNSFLSYPGISQCPFLGIFVQKLFFIQKAVNLSSKSLLALAKQVSTCFEVFPHTQLL